MPMLSSYLKVKIFADGADRAGMLEMNANPLIKGLTTNPTLMRKAGVSDYERFARDILSVVTEKPISLEVFSDDFDEMERQALKIASWGNNVYVEDSGQQHEARGGLSAHPQARGSRSKGQCNSDHDGHAGSRRSGKPEQRSPFVHFRICRANRGHWARSGAIDGSKYRACFNKPKSRSHLGKSARAS